MLEPSTTPNDGYMMLNGGMSEGIYDLFLDLKSFGEVFILLGIFLV